ncbi:MAG: PAS domain S-box protein [Candidatus Omnitrophota bacterium]|jgi:PAS domain S-box-containing protein|nr:MAG: PAS domain S-box protein [Candidatus Omnitrophota bacterium]
MQLLRIGCRRLFSFRFLFLVFVMGGCFCFAKAPSGEYEPLEGCGQRWQIVSFLQDAELSGRNIFQLSFEKTEMMWVASSDGLYRYNGYQWTKYTKKDGLPSNVIRCVHVSGKGDVWIGSDRGAGVFNPTNLTFSSMASDANPAGNSIRRIREDREGTLWFCSDGWPDPQSAQGLTSFKDWIWTKHGPENGLPSDCILDYFMDSRGRQYVLTDNGVSHWNGARWIQSVEQNSLADSPLHRGWIVESGEGDLLVITPHTTFLRRQEQWEEVPLPPKWINTAVCSTRDGEILMCTRLNETENAFYRWNQTRWDRLTQGFPASEYPHLESLHEGPDGSIWSVGYDYFMRWERKTGEWRCYTQLPPPQFVDHQGHVWFFEPQGKRAIRYDGNRWNEEPLLANVGLDAEKNVYSWESHTFIHRTPDGLREFRKDDLGLLAIDGFISRKSGGFGMYGKDADGVVLLQQVSRTEWEKKRIPDLREKTILQGYSDPIEGIWFLTEEPKSKQQQIIHLLNESVNRYPLPFPHKNHKERLFLDSKSTLWIYGDFGAFYLDRSLNAGWIPIENLEGKHVIHCHETEAGIWLAYDGLSGGKDGLALIGKDTFKTYDFGIKRSLTYHDDTILFFYGKQKLYFISQDTHHEPHPLTIPLQGSAAGLVHDPNGNVWIGLNGLVLRYSPDRIPPETSIHTPIKQIQEKSPLPIRFIGAEKYRPNQIRKTYQFSWRIDAGEWSRFQPAPTAPLEIPGLAPGNHVLEVRARDEGLDIDPTPARFEFLVASIPLQQRTWFKPLVFSVFLIIVLLSLVSIRTAFKANSTKRELAYYTGQLEGKVKSQTEALRESETLYYSLIHHLPQYIFRKNRQGRFIFVNHHFCTLLGKTPEEILGKTDLDFYPIELAKKYREDDLKVLETGSIFETIEENQTQNGTKTWVQVLKTPVYDAEQKSIAVQGIFWDISELIRAKNELQKSQVMLKLVINNIPQIIFWQDNRLTYLGCNENFARIAGLNRPEDIVGKTDSELAWNEETAKRFEEINRSVMESDRLRLHVLETLTTRDNQSIRVDTNKIPLHDTDGNVVGILSTYEDITERMKMEEEKTDLAEQLRQSQKMESIGRLAGGVAHDFNNLLTVILGYCDLLGGKVQADSPQFRHIVEIEKSAKRASALTNQLLAFSRKQIIQPKVLNLNKIVTEMDSMLRRLIGEDIELVTIPDPELGHVNADPGQIEQIIINLVVNARDAMPTGGKLTIETLNVVIREDFLRYHFDIEPGSYILLSIKDTGVGMDAKTKSHIFEPFFTTKEKDKGTGLGLSTVYGIVKQNGGSISVISESNVGTSFKIYLPRVEKEQPSASPAPAITPELKGTETILLVEDEEMVRSLARYILEHHGYHVLVAQYGNEALQISQKYNGPIHLLISDIVMPSMGGRELAEQLNLIRPDTKILYMSGYTTTAITPQNMKDLHAGFLQKPFTPEELVRKTREILDAD